MRPGVLGIVAAWSAALAACDPIVVDLVQPDQSARQSAVATALAWKGSDGAVNATNDTIALVPEDPDALVLSFTNVDPTCKVALSPDAFSVCAAEDEWQLVLSIPPELDRPAVIDLNDPRIQFYWTLHFASCGGGGGGLGNGSAGTLEIVASDATAVTVQLRDATRPEFDGDYVAARCGSATPEFTPTPAVAVRGASLTSDPSSGSGATPDPDALIVFLGTTPGTCADPRPTVDCQTNRQMVLSLPPALQVPGDVALTDPQLDAAYTGPETGCAKAAPSTGTLTIVSIDQTKVVLRIYGSELAAFDGDYAGALCR